MRILVIGATGTIGTEVAAALARDHEVVAAAHSSGDVRVDLGDPASIAAMYRAVGPMDAVVSTAGVARFGPLLTLSDDDLRISIDNKLMGQVNLIRLGLDSVRDGGSFTVTTGELVRHPMPGSAAITLVSGGLEGFVRAAALEMPRGIRVNVVSPGWVSETLDAMGRDPLEGTPASVVARSYVQAVEGDMTGEVLSVT